MMTFRSILCPVDFSPQSRTALQYAVAMAHRFDGRLTVLFVNDPLLLAAANAVYRGQPMPPWLRSADHSHDRRRIDKAKAALEGVRTKLFSGLPSTSTAVAIGNPAHEIARLTRRPESLVVMSLRGTSGVWGSRRGAVAYHVLTHSSIPVLALPRRRLGGRFASRAAKATAEIVPSRDRAEIAGMDALLPVRALDSDRQRSSMGGGRR